MQEFDFPELADPAEEILVRVEASFVQRADVPLLDESGPANSADD